MESYYFRDAAKLMIHEDPREDKIHSKYKDLESHLLNVGIISRGDYVHKGFRKNDIILLDEEFIKEFPKEANLYFEERIVNDKYYQLRITELGIKEL